VCGTNDSLWCVAGLRLTNGGWRSHVLQSTDAGWPDNRQQLLSSRCVVAVRVQGGRHRLWVPALGSPGRCCLVGVGGTRRGALPKRGHVGQHVPWRVPPARGGHWVRIHLHGPAVADAGARRSTSPPTPQRRSCRFPNTHARPQGGPCGCGPQSVLVQWPSMRKSSAQMWSWRARHALVCGPPSSKTRTAWVAGGGAMR